MIDESEEVDMFGRTVPREAAAQNNHSDNEYEESESRRRRRRSFSPDQSAAQSAGQARRRSRSPINHSNNQSVRRSRSRSRERRPFYEDRGGRASTGSINGRYRQNHQSNNQPNPRSYDRRQSDFIPRLVGPPVMIPQLNQPNNPPVAQLKREFFNIHKADEWFVEQYGFHGDQSIAPYPTPSINQAFNPESIKQRKAQFDVDLTEGVTIHYHLNADVEPPTSTPNKEFTDNLIVIPVLPLKITRQAITQVFEGLEGFRCFTFSPLTQKKGAHRMGFVLFRSEADCMNAFEKVNNQTIDGFELHLRKNNRTLSKREAPCSTKQPDRVLVDLEKAIRLVKHFDTAREITDNILLTNESIHEQIKSQSPISQLNHYLAYLRYVHCYCYYCAEQFADLDQLIHRCGQTHLRANQTSPLDEEALQRIDQAIDLCLTINPADSKISPIHIRHMENAWKTSIDKKADEKFTCKHCVNKHFKSEDFIRKHIQNKHATVLAEALTKANEEYLLENYMQDVQALFDERRRDMHDERRASGGHQPMYQQHNQPMHFSPHSMQPMAIMPSFSMLQHDIRGLRSYADLDKPDTAPVLPDHGLLLTTPQEAKKHYADVGAKWQPKSKKGKTDAAPATTS